MKADEAIDALKKCFEQDSDLAWAWHCNLSVSFMDEGGSHQQANLASARFMKTAFGIDITNFEQWNSFTWVKSCQTTL